MRCLFFIVALLLMTPMAWAGTYRCDALGKGGAKIQIEAKDDKKAIHDCTSYLGYKNFKIFIKDENGKWIPVNIQLVS